MNDQEERKNPFFLPYDTPHDVPPFDRIRLEDYEEAMARFQFESSRRILKEANDFLLAL